MTPNILEGLIRFGTDVKGTFKIDLVHKTADIALVGVAYVGTNIYKLAKSRYQHGNSTEKQASLCQEAERLLRLRATLAVGTDPSAKLTSAQTAVASQLNQVLEKLSHLLTEPEPSRANSRPIQIIGKCLLLYRAPGIISAVMHGVFFLLVFFWGLTVCVGFKGTNDTLTSDIAVSLILLLPVVLWNYLTRKLDNWFRSRHSAANPIPVAVLSK